MDTALTAVFAQIRDARIESDRIKARYDAAVDDLRQRWAREISGTADFDVCAFAEDDEERDAEASGFVGGDKAAAKEIVSAVRRLDEQTVRALAPVVDPLQRQLSSALEKWVASAGDNARKDWGSVLQQWRQAVGIAARPAAEALGVSASSIVRYEQGDRIPSGAQLQALVRAMAHAPIVPPPWDNEDRTTRAVAASLGVDRNEYAEVVDSSSTARTIINDRWSAEVDGLSNDQRSVLAAILQRPGALSSLLALAEFVTGDDGAVVAGCVAEARDARERRHGYLARPKAEP